MSDPSRERRFLDTAASRGLRPAGRTHVEKTLRELSSFFSRSMFREETARRPGLLQRVDPRARILVTLLFLVSVSLARSIPELLAHAILPLAAIPLSRIRPGEFLGAGFLIAIVFSVLMAAPATLNVFFDGTVIIPLIDNGREWRYGPYFLPAVIGITREGLLTAATFLLRALTSVAAVLWLTLSTRWSDLLRALRFFRLPAIFLQVIGMTVRYTHALLRHSEETHLGKKSRTVCRTKVAAEQAWVGSRIARSWERSLHLMEEVSMAMSARGFTGEAKLIGGPWFGAPEWGLLLAVVLFCTGAHLA
ncbi:MAG: energy-coupling factor transporter transmembrane component T [Candidatus Deferrimicrobiaceae bacterium]|jgi:cobalt ECF transporter T component CbiQ